MRCRAASGSLRVCDQPFVEEVSAARAQSLGLRAQLEAMILSRSSLYLSSVVPKSDGCDRRHSMT